jgi:RsiW-degrading membrane proteinase PrsW (M82 family)
MAAELLICLIHNPPMVDGIINASQMGKKLRYSISTYIAVFMLLRIYLLFRLYTSFSRYRSTFADRCCSKIGIEADASFSIKCSFQENPFQLLFFTFFLSAIAIGLAVRLFERPYYDDDTPKKEWQPINSEDHDY